MPSRERSITVSITGLLRVVYSRGTSMLVDLSAIDAIVSISCTFCRVIEALVSWIITGDSGFLVNRF
jgi:hypothetical protein